MKLKEAVNNLSEESDTSSEQDSSPEENSKKITLRQPLGKTDEVNRVMSYRPIVQVARTKNYYPRPTPADL